PQWHLSADILRLLAPTAIIQAILSTTGSVFMAKGKTNVLMKLGIIGAILQVGSFLIGVNYSISTFSFLYLIANIFNFFPVMYCLAKIINSKISAIFIKIAPIFFSSLIMILSLRLLSFYSPLYEINNIFILACHSLFGLIIYASSIIFFSKTVRKFVFSRVKNFKLG
ncbi:TPA: polysaccharide biosynthesis C-terminal domain-containing protein, partial [Klebsiella quasipneumoniae]